ncbi:MAG: response regulator [Bradymonadia bacterium]
MSEKTIYIVDDSMTARLWARSALLNLKPEWQVVDASNGEEAINKTEEQVPDALLIDINMPGLDGFETAAQVREKYPEVPIALLTANVQARIQNRAAEQGYTFIGKPVSPAKLQHFIEGV